MPKRKLRIAVVAGEPSGDILAAGMVAELKSRYPDAVIEGIAGPHMQAAGCRSLFDMETLSVMGLVEVIRHLPAILKIKRGLLAHFDKKPPDIYIGVDAPDFNLRVEKALKQRGIKTVHYVSPTVWAWREKRIHKIASATNRVLGIFPFEKAVYDKYNVPYSFVGHTMADAVPMAPDKQAARTAIGMAGSQRLVAVLPGSRRGEVDTLLPVFIESIREMLQRLPDIRFVIPAANEYRYADIDNVLKVQAADLIEQGALRLLQGQSRTTMIASDAILLASGTATLEAMLCKRPMVVAYKLAPMTYRMMQYLYKADFFSLPNLLAHREIVPELLQEDVNPQRLSKEVLRFLEQDNTALLNTFCELHSTLRQDADVAAVDAIVEVMNE